VLEIGGSRGYSTIWLGGGARYLGGRVVSIERDPEAARRWRENVAEAGLEDWVELIEGDALDVLHEVQDVFDVVFIDAEKEQYEHYFGHARQRVEAGGLVVADNVLSHRETLEEYSRARQSDPTLVSTTVPLDRGLELSVVLCKSL
jgi:predicted O-methyltransferase YrrM